jgi:hypothetical protein
MRMVVIDERPHEAERHRLPRDVPLRRWLARHGADCGPVWNRVAAPSLGLWLEP